MLASERKELAFTLAHRSTLSPSQTIPTGLLWQFISGRLEIQLGPLPIGMPCEGTVRCNRGRVGVRKILPFFTGMCLILGGGGKEP